MAPRITLPGGGAIDLDVQEARILNVGLLEVEGSTTQTDVDNSAAPRSYIDRGDLRVWNATTAYVAQDYVIYEGRLYFANADNTNIMPMPRPNEVTQWSELERSDFFLQITADDDVMITANDHEHNVTVEGGLGITTSATASTDTLTISLNAALENLSNVDSTGVTTGQLLQATVDAEDNVTWSPVTFTGDSYVTARADSGTEVDASSTITALRISGSGTADRGIDTEITIDEDNNEAEITISAADAFASSGISTGDGTSGFLSGNDKALLDAVRTGGYENSSLNLSTPNRSEIQLTDDSTAFGTAIELAERLDLNELRDVDVQGATNNQVLQYDGTNWGAVDLAAIEDHGGREWNPDVSYTIGDIVSLLVSTTRQMFIAVADNMGMANRPVDETTLAVNANWQEASLLRLRDIANIEITSDPGDRALLIWDSAESEWVASTSVFSGGAGIRVDNTTGTISYDGNTANGDYDFPTAAGSDDVIMNPGDYFIQNRTRYRYTGISNTGFLTRRVVAEATIPESALNSPEFERVGVQPATHLIPVNRATVVYRGDVVIQSDTDNNSTAHMFLGISTVGGQPTAVDSLTVAASTRISDDDLAAHFLTLEVDTTYTLGATQATATDPVTVTLTGSDTSTSAFDIAGTGSVTLTRGTDGNVTVNGREPQAYTIPSGNPDETVTIYRGDVLIQDNVPYMWLGVGGPSTALVAEDSKVIQTNSRITADFLAEHYLTLDTKYTLGTSQATTNGPVTITLDGTAGTDTSFDLVAGDHTTISRGADGNITITGVDTDTVNIPTWAADTEYTAGDQVIHDGGSNVNSIYIAISDHTSAADNPPSENQAQWHLVRSGLVSVRGPDDTGPAGITGNSTLRFNEGSGINITRDGTAFTVTARGTGHSDASDFTTGYKYSFYPLYGEGYQTGVVGALNASETIDRVEIVNEDALTWLINGTNLTAGQDYGTVVSGTTLTSLFPDYPSPPDEGIIVYGFADTSDPNRRFHVTQLDPPVANTGTLNSYARVSPANPRDVNSSVGLYTLNPDHADNSYVPSIWAREQQDGTDTPNPVPDAKLSAVDTWARTANPTEIIPRTKLPADLVDQGTFPVTRAAGVESVVVSDTGEITTTLNPIPTNINDLLNVDFDATATGPQNLEYNSTDNEWELTPASSGRVVFTNAPEGSTTWEATSFITDPTNPSITTRIRDTGFTGDAGSELLTFQLVDESNLMSTISFPAQTFVVYDWDQPSTENLSSMINVTEDPFSDRFFNLLATTSPDDAGRFNIIPADRARDQNWTITYVTGERPMAPAVTSGANLHGGLVGLTSFTARSDDGVVMNTDETSGMQVGWRSVEILDTNRNFGTAVNFLNPYTSYTWTTEVINLNETNSAVLLFNDAGTDLQGTVTYTGAGGTNTPIPDGTLSIGGAVGIVTLTHTIDIWNNDTLADDVLFKNINRGPEVDGTARSFNVSVMRNETPNFEYPLFWVAVDEGDPIPSSTEFRSGTPILGGVRTGERQRDTVQLAGIGIDLTATTNVRTLYVAYPRALNAPISQNSTTTAPGNPPSTVTTSIPENDRSTTDIALIGDGAPPTAAEQYSWFRVNIPANVDYRLNNVSA